MTLAIGQRVRVREGAFEFGGVVGTIDVPPDGIHDIDLANWIGAHKYEQRRNRRVLVYWVRFDEPTDDGSGDGPYWGAGITEEELEGVCAAS